MNTEWTPERLEAQGYLPDHDEDENGLPRPNPTDRRVNANAAHRESLMPSSRSAGQPLADKEPFTPRTERERLEADPERTRRMMEARKELGF